jgi:hypothetical protein
VSFFKHAALTLSVGYPHPTPFADTIYIGKLGPAALGGVGVAISAQYSVSKLYNE